MSKGRAPNTVRLLLGHELHPQPRREGWLTLKRVMAMEERRTGKIRPSLKSVLATEKKKC